jgi:3',5'-cyclic AMP phosphodiesterase CpdA
MTDPIKLLSAQGNLSRWLRWMTVLAMLAISHDVSAADQNHFASIYLDGKKIGQIHYTVRTNEKGMVEELKTRSSLSILGIQIYYFTQDLHEVWSQGELQSMQGDTDDHRTVYKSSVQRTPEDYNALLNGKALTLPRDAFPNSVWHYEITQKSLLFDLKDLRLMKVKVSKSDDSVSVVGRSIPASRFDFSGDWQASIWFDQNKQLLKMNYKAEGRDIVITMDSN